MKHAIVTSIPTIKLSKSTPFIYDISIVSISSIILYDLLSLSFFAKNDTIPALNLSKSFTIKNAITTTVNILIIDDVILCTVLIE